MKSKTSVNKLKLALLFFFATALISCLKDTNKKNCTDKSLTATADGKAFESCVITAVPYPTYIWIQAVKDDAETSIHLYIPKKTGTFEFGGYTTMYIGQLMLGKPTSQISYTTDTIHTGVLNITKYDSVAKVISGDFNFNARQQYPAGTGTKSVTGGAFNDIKWE